MGSAPSVGGKGAQAGLCPLIEPLITQKQPVCQDRGGNAKGRDPRPSRNQVGLATSTAGTVPARAPPSNDDHGKVEWPAGHFPTIHALIEGRRSRPHDGRLRDQDFGLAFPDPRIG